MRLIITLLFFYLTGCGIGLDIPKHDSRFDPILKQFKQDADFFGRSADTSKISIAFGNPRKEYELLGFVKLSKDPGASDAVCFAIPKDSNEIIKTFNRSMYGKYAGDKIIVVDDSFQTRS